MLLFSNPGQGLSPRVRGNPSGGGGEVWASGSIPACAGEPEILSNAALMPPVYPRVCGGTLWDLE